MTEPVTVEQVKVNLGIGADVTDQDNRIAELIVAARRKVEIDTRRIIVADVPTLAGSDLELAKQAIHLIVGTWFASREGVAADGRIPAELPLGVRWIIDALKRWDSGDDE